MLITTNAAMTFNLPAASSSFLVSFKDITGNADTNNITIHRAGAESIEAVAADYVFAAPFGEFTLICDGTNYYLAAK